MRPPPDRIWFDAAARIARTDQVAVFTENQQRVLDYLWEEYSGLYLGLPGEVHSKESVFILSRTISARSSVADKRECFDFLARGFERGNLNLPGWDVPLGPVYIKINREENFSRQDLFRPIASAEEFVAAFAAALPIRASLDRSALVGQILLSAVLFGGLLDRKWLKPFQQCLLEKTVYQEGAFVWVDMSDGRSEDTQRVERRLVFDRLTRLLVYRYLRMGAAAHTGTVSGNPWQNITAYLRQAGFTP